MCLSRVALHLGAAQLKGWLCGTFLKPSERPMRRLFITSVPYTESLTKPTLSNLPLGCPSEPAEVGLLLSGLPGWPCKIRVWRCPPLRTGQPASTLSAPTQPGIFQAALSSSACPLYSSHPAPNGEHSSQPQNEQPERRAAEHANPCHLALAMEDGPKVQCVSKLRGTPNHAQNAGGGPPRALFSPLELFLTPF